MASNSSAVLHTSAEVEACHEGCRHLHTHLTFGDLRSLRIAGVVVLVDNLRQAVVQVVGLAVGFAYVKKAT